MGGKQVARLQGLLAAGSRQQAKFHLLSPLLIRLLMIRYCYLVIIIIMAIIVVTSE